LHSRHEFFVLDDSSGRVGPFNDFFVIVCKLCKRPHFFLIVVGRSEGMSIRNHVGEVSKILLKFIPLSPLDQASMEEHLEKSTFKNAPVSSFLCHHGFPIKDVSELQLEYTGGVPGLLVRAVTVLLNYATATPNVSLTREIVESILNDPVNARECVFPYLPCLEVSSDERKATMKKIILSCLYCVRFGSQDSGKESGQDSAYVYDLVTDFGFYRRECSKPGEEEMYQIWIPKLLASYLETEFSSDIFLAYFFVPLVHNLFISFMNPVAEFWRVWWLPSFTCLLLCVTIKILYYPLFLSCLQYGIEWTWSFRLIQLHFMLCRLYISRKHIKNKEDQVGNEQHLVTMNGNESFTRNSLTIRFTFAYMPLQTYQIFYSSYKNVLLGIKRCLLVLLVKVVGALEA